MKKSLLFFGFFFIYLVQSFGQCSCSGTFYYLDSDEDGYPDKWQSADAGAAYTDHIDSGCGEGIAGNIIFSCTRPNGKYTTNHVEDCSENDPNVWRTNSWYTDEDGDGAYGTWHSGCQTPPSDSRPNRNDCDDGVIFQTLPFYKIILL